MQETEKRWEGGWAVLELMGHRRLAGRVSEANFAGAVLLRIDVPVEVPTKEGLVQETWVTQFYGGSAIFCVSPVSEELARAVAKHAKPEPVHTWEIPRPALPAGIQPPPPEPVEINWGRAEEVLDGERPELEEEDLEGTPPPRSPEEMQSSSATTTAGPDDPPLTF